MRYQIGTDSSRPIKLEKLEEPNQGYNTSTDLGKLAFTVFSIHAGKLQRTQPLEIRVETRLFRRPASEEKNSFFKKKSVVNFFLSPTSNPNVCGQF
jgi:hypothetical protein